MSPRSDTVSVRWLLALVAPLLLAGCVAVPLVELAARPAAMLATQNAAACTSGRPGCDAPTTAQAGQQACGTGSPAPGCGGGSSGSMVQGLAGSMQRFLPVGWFTH